MNDRKTPAPGAHPVNLDDSRTRRAFALVRRLAVVYLALSAGTVALVAQRSGDADVNDTVWTRAVIVVASAVLTLSFCRRAAQGSRSGYKRLRIVTIVMPVAIVVIVALPGVFPMWMKIEQVACGVLLVAAAAVVNGRHLRSVFRGAPSTE